MGRWQDDTATASYALGVDTEATMRFRRDATLQQPEDRGLTAKWEAAKVRVLKLRAPRASKPEAIERTIQWPEATGGTE